jgi:hypothetical protein
MYSFRSRRFQLSEDLPDVRGRHLGHSHASANGYAVTMRRREVTGI